MRTNTIESMSRHTKKQKILGPVRQDILKEYVKQMEIPGSTIVVAINRVATKRALSYSQVFEIVEEAI